MIIANKEDNKMDFEKEMMDLIKEAHEARLLKRLLAKKLNEYGGIKHDELKDICTMFNITEDDEE
jgi:hypothetical protein